MAINHKVASWAGAATGFGGGWLYSFFIGCHGA